MIYNLAASLLGVWVYSSPFLSFFPSLTTANRMKVDLCGCQLHKVISSLKSVFQRGAQEHCKLFSVSYLIKWLRDDTSLFARWITCTTILKQWLWSNLHPIQPFKQLKANLMAAVVCCHSCIWIILKSWRYMLIRNTKCCRNVGLRQMSLELIFLTVPESFCFELKICSNWTWCRFLEVGDCIQSWWKEWM